MHWLEAAGKSSQGIAWRTDKFGRTYNRRTDGTGTVALTGPKTLRSGGSRAKGGNTRTYKAALDELEGFTDWQPL